MNVSIQQIISIFKVTYFCVRLFPVYNLIRRIQTVCKLCHLKIFLSIFVYHCIFFCIFVFPSKLYKIREIRDIISEKSLLKICFPLTQNTLINKAAFQVNFVVIIHLISSVSAICLEFIHKRQHVYVIMIHCGCQMNKLHDIYSFIIDRTDFMSVMLFAVKEK